MDANHEKRILVSLVRISAAAEAAAASIASRPIAAFDHLAEIKHAADDATAAFTPAAADASG